MSKALLFLFAIATSTTYAQLNCNCATVRTNADTPNLALRIWNKEKVNDETVANYFPKLTSANEEERLFYFVVLTRAMTFSDGAASEVLGYEATAFVQNDLQQFTWFFTTGCVQPSDVRTWAFAAFIELQIENDPSSIKRAVKEMQSIIKKKAKSLPSENQLIAALFNDYLEIALKTVYPK